MINCFYSVKDVKTGTFCNPFIVQNDVSAVRMFSYSVNDHTVQSSLSLYPHDFELYKVGSFDDNSGKISSLDSNEFIVSGSSVIAKIHNTDERPGQSPVDHP
nr:MAG: nonstructural protein [Microviridae sp.]